MITYEIGKLMTFKEHYATFAEIGFEAVGKPVEDTLLGLQIYDVRDMDCVVVRDGDEIIGYTLYGLFEKFFGWSTQMPLLLKLRAAGIKEVFIPMNIHFRKEYWGKGIYLETTRRYSADMLARGVKHMLLWSYATQRAADYSLGQPGATIFEGMTGPQGHPVGVRDLAVFLRETEPAE
jgi:hypothetical protein